MNISNRTETEPYFLKIQSQMANSKFPWEKGRGTVIENGQKEKYIDLKGNALCAFDFEN